jgi:excisionase family DNA binding protein
MALKDEYVTITEAARLLDVTRQTISRWVSEGKLNIQRVGREALINKGDIRKFEGQRVSSSYGEAVIKLILGIYTDYCWAKGYITMQERVENVNPGKGYIEVAVKRQGGITRIIKLTPRENKKVLAYIKPRLKVLVEEVYHVGRETGMRFGIMERELLRKAVGDNTNK